MPLGGRQLTDSLDEKPKAYADPLLEKFGASRPKERKLSRGEREKVGRIYSQQVSGGLASFELLARNPLGPFSTETHICGRRRPLLHLKRRFTTGLDIVVDGCDGRFGGVCGSGECLQGCKSLSGSVLGVVMLVLKFSSRPAGEADTALFLSREFRIKPGRLTDQLGR
jgi:hypothetical protein